MSPPAGPDAADLRATLDVSGDEIRVSLRVRPGAKRSEVVGLVGDRVKVAVAAPPVDGKANKVLLAFLAKVFGVRKGDVRLVAGAASRDKRVAVRLPLDTAAAALRSALA